MMADTLPKMLAYIRAAKDGRQKYFMLQELRIPTYVLESLPLYSQPMSITQMEKIFSGLVLGETFPKPTLVRLLKVK